MMFVICGVRYVLCQDDLHLAMHLDLDSLEPAFEHEDRQKQIPRGILISSNIDEEHKLKFTKDRLSVIFFFGKHPRDSVSARWMIWMHQDNPNGIPMGIPSESHDDS